MDKERTFTIPGSNVELPVEALRAADRDEMVDTMISHGGEQLRRGLYEAIAGQATLVLSLAALAMTAVVALAGSVLTGHCDAIAPCDPAGSTVTVAVGLALIGIAAVGALVTAAVRTWTAGRRAEAALAKRAARTAALGLAITLIAAGWIIMLGLNGAELNPWP